MRIDKKNLAKHSFFFVKMILYIIISRNKVWIILTSKIDIHNLNCIFLEYFSVVITD